MKIINIKFMILACCTALALFTSSKSVAFNQSNETFIIPFNGTLHDHQDFRIFYMQDSIADRYELGFRYDFESFSDDRKEERLREKLRECHDRAERTLRSCLDRVADNALIREAVIIAGTLFFGATATPPAGSAFAAFGTALNARDTAKEYNSCNYDVTRNKAGCL